MGHYLISRVHALFAGVGMASIRVKKDTTDDYLVAGRGMHPALADYLLFQLGTLGSCSSDLLDSWVDGILGNLGFNNLNNWTIGRVDMALQVHPERR